MPSALRTPLYAPWQWIQKNSNLLWVLILGGLLLHVLTWWLGRYILPDWRGLNTFLHTTLEVLGTGLAILIALWILLLYQAEQGPSYSLRISGALLMMGILDGFHALCPPGDAFVWLHSMATLLGGLAFVCNWLPTHWFDNSKVRWPLLMAGVAVAVGIFSLILPQGIPPMLEAGKFTRWAQLLNLLGGALLLAAALRFYLTWRQSRNGDDLLFFLHGAFFGLAAIMFEQSQLWDFAWWSWHGLRLMAYLVAFLFVFRSQQRILRQLSLGNRELKEQQDTLALQNKEMEQLNYLVSHDLKEPVRSLEGLVSLLKTDPDTTLSQDSEKYLALMEKSTVRMRNLIKGLLEHSRIGESLVPSKIKLEKILKAVREDLSQTLAETDAILELDELPEIEAYETELRLLLQNLIGNALKFRKPNQIPHVRLVAEATPGGWQFAIADNGIGIPESQKEQIFGMFKRLHPRDHYQGSGIGLAHCQKIVQLHGGNIWVESTPNDGSTFYFTLPQPLPSHRIGE